MLKIKNLKAKIDNKEILKGLNLEIKPGEVNWMTAGKGVVHSERTPEYLRKEDKFLHGLQIWIGLPKELEQSEASFFHISKDEIPTWEEGGVTYKLIAGKIKGKQSPVPVHSPLYFIEIKTKTPQKVNIGDKLFGEVGMYVLDGTVKIEGIDYVITSRESPDAFGFGIDNPT